MPFNPDKINIHELTIEEPEQQSELPFDSEKEITPEDWDRINEFIKEHVENDDWQNSLSRAVSCKIIDPGHETGLKELAEKEFSKAKRPNMDALSWWVDFKNSFYKGRGDIGLCAEIIDHAMELRLDITNMLDDRLLSKMEEDLNRQRANNYLGYMPVYASLARKVSLFCRFLGKSFVLPDEDWKKFDEYLQRYKEGEAWGQYASVAESVKLMDSKRDLHLDEVAWRGMKHHFNEKKNSDEIGQAFDVAEAMTILAAEKVEVTDQGLKLTMPKKKESLAVTPDIPETKQF